MKTTEAELMLMATAAIIGDNRWPVRGYSSPAASGEYCSDETPYCCGTPGNYYCATDVNHC